MAAIFQARSKRIVAFFIVALVLCPLPFVSCEVETAGQAIRFSTAAQGVMRDGQSVGAFETSKGWTVELESAHAVLGPIYFYGGAPMARANPWLRVLGGAAWACPTHSQYDYGAVLGEVLSQYVVDLLADKPTSTGEVRGEAGTCHSAELHIHPPGDQRLPAGSPTIEFEKVKGASIVLQGTAGKQDRQVPFWAHLDVPDQGTMRIVQNIEAAVELDDTSVRKGSLVVQIFVDAWLDQVDFGSLTEIDPNGRFLFSESTQARSALLQAVRNRYSYSIAWSEQ